MYESLVGKGLKKQSSKYKSIMRIVLKPPYKFLTAYERPTLAGKNMEANQSRTRSKLLEIGWLSGMDSQPLSITLTPAILQPPGIYNGSTFSQRSDIQDPVTGPWLLRGRLQGKG